MAELEGIKLNPDNQLLLEGPSLRLPFELSRLNLKTAQKHIEKERENVLASVKTLTQGLASGKSKEQNLAQMDSIIARLKGFKRKLEELEAERQELNKQTSARLLHLNELWKIPTVSDVKYEEWSKVRLNRMLVDYMLRQGHTESATLLAKEKGIEDLVDVKLFVAANRVATALRKGSLTEALSWCSEHKPLMKSLKTSTSNPSLRAAGAATTATDKVTKATESVLASLSSGFGPSPLTATVGPPPSSTSLEFQLRLQQYINLLNPAAGSGSKRNVTAASAHAKKYLTPHIGDPLHRADVRATGMLLIYPPERSPLQYAGYYSPARWQMLADLFTSTFLELWGLPHEANLERALNAGLTALKTPSCHSVHATPNSAIHGADVDDGAASGGGDRGALRDPPPGTVPGARLCPICSTELNALAKDLPYAHHSQSLVDPDPVVLPNNRIYGKEKLRQYSEKMGVQAGLVKDPVTGEEFEVEKSRKVFIM